jgi:predicted O-methyltransferase YrrM
MSNPDTLTDDVEASQFWLERLRSLNAVIAATGEPLRGNLFYGHHQPDYATSPPSAIYRAKRERMRQALRGSTRLLEVGVNGGHSAYLALTANPSLEFHGVDICTCPYVKLAVAWLEKEFPGRVFLHAGDSMKVLPELVRSSLRFDCFHIDGAKHTYYHDILNCLAMIAGTEAVIIVDDTQRTDVSPTWRRCIRQGLIEHIATVPPMPVSVTSHNEIGALQPTAAWKRRSLLMYAKTLDQFHRAGLRQKILRGPFRRFAS